MQQADARRHFRVHYPSALRPQLHLGLAALDVLDLSESGLRCAGSVEGLHVGAAVASLLRFRHGRGTRVEGDIVRLGPSFQLMLGEQRAVMSTRRYSVR